MKARSVRSTSLIVLSSLSSAAIAFAAPPELSCAEDDSTNCFRDDVFVLDGNESVLREGTAIPLVGCESSGDCYLNGPDDAFHSEGLTAAVLRALELMRERVPSLPAWDEVVVFTADFGPEDQPGPLFYRAQNAAGAPVNRVQNIGLAVAEPDPDQPFLGIIDGGNVGGLGTTPTTAVYNQCGRLPPRSIDPPLAQPIGALCAPGVYSYFDALAQATAALYGPYITGGDSGRSLVTLPLTKTALVTAEGASKFPSNGPALHVWNAFLDTRGSLLGGNTWRDNGNGTFETARPSAFYGVSAPYEARQALRFQPIDLYLLGFAPSDEVVEPLRTFSSATPADLYLPAGLDDFDSTFGPAMGTRVAGVVLRSRSGLPRSISIEEILGANGARVPAVDAAPQQIRQLWIVVTKPDTLRDQIATEASASAVEDDPAADVQAAFDESLEEQADEQAAQIEDIQRFRRQYNLHFYALAGYRGRVVTTFEGSVDDLSYWEFADPADEAPLFVASGGLELALNGLQPVPNGAGARQSVLSVRTPGEGGSFSYAAQAGRALRIRGSADIQGSNNVFSVRMRLPNDPALAGRLKARLVLDGPGGRSEVSVPSHPEAYLVPDGRFRNYTVLLSSTLSVQPIVPEEPLEGEEADGEDPETEEVVSTENTAFTGKDYTSFTFTPANAEVSGIDIEFIRIGNSTDLGDVDKDCDGKLALDGFLGAEDNCPTIFNPNQSDGNADGIGDACEDFDGDILINSCDNCPGHGNSGQQDGNGNGIGDACDPSDTDGCEVRQGGESSQRVALLLAVGAVALAFSRRRARCRPASGRAGDE